MRRWRSPPGHARYPVFAPPRPPPGSATGEKAHLRAGIAGQVQTNGSYAPPNGAGRRSCLAVGREEIGKSHADASRVARRTEACEVLPGGSEIGRASCRERV